MMSKLRRQVMNTFNREDIMIKLGNQTQFHWKAPSNIAFIKYWGKVDFQLPTNASVSMTLKNCHTDCEMTVTPDQKGTVGLLFEGQRDEKFESKLVKHIQRLQIEFPILGTFSYEFKTSNTFPHSAGIASSASSMAAINLCLCELLLKLGEVKEDVFFRDASRLARMGSGSASRSLYGGYVDWGKTTKEYGTQVTDIHSEFQRMGDAVLIIDSSEKEVSSSLGHKLMMEHPYRDQRFALADKKCEQMIEILQSGDWERFIPMLETEALELHALMMSGQQWFVLMKPNTLEIIDRLKKWRKESKARVAFTLDAGPNLHLIYHQEDKDKVHQFIKEYAHQLLENQKWIDDEIGEGPIKGELS